VGGSEAGGGPTTYEGTQEAPVSETDDGTTTGADADDLSDDGVGATATDEPTTFEPEEDPDAASEA